MYECTKDKTRARIVIIKIVRIVMIIILIIMMICLDLTNIATLNINIHNINPTLWVNLISPFIAVFGTYYFMRRENERMEKNQEEIAKRGWNKQNGLIIKEELKKFYYNNYIPIRIKSIDEYVKLDIIGKVDSIYEKDLTNIDNFCNDINDLEKFNKKFLKKLKFDFDYEPDILKCIDVFEKTINKKFLKELKFDFEYDPCKGTDDFKERSKFSVWKELTESICLNFLSMNELQDIEKDTREMALEKFWNYHNKLCDDKYRSNLADAMLCKLSIVGDGKYFNEFKEYYSGIKTEENGNKNKKYSNPMFIKESNYI